MTAKAKAKAKAKTKAKPKRRMGPDDAVTRTLLMDAAENVMREQGYAAISARNVAARAELKYQIVFYYFETMDDLLAATYRRNSEKVLESVVDALKSEQPLRALWALWSNPFDGAIALEFMAAANHSKALHAEWLIFTEKLGRTLGQGLRDKAAAGNAAFTPRALGAILASVGSTTSFQSSLAPARDNAETRALIDWMLDQFEPAPSGKRKARR